MKLKDVKKQLDTMRAGDAGKVEEQVADLKKEQFNLRFQAATGQLSSTARVREVRRSIARAKTVLRQKRPAKSV